jgi:hypothetical protein
MNRNKHVCRYRSWTVIGCTSVTCHLYTYVYVCIFICLYMNHLHWLFRNLFDSMMHKNWKKCAACSKTTQFSKSIFRTSFFSSPSQQKTSKTAIFSLFSIRHQITLTNWYKYYNNDFWWFLLISLISVDFSWFLLISLISCDFLVFSWFPWFLVISLISRDFLDFSWFLWFQLDF